MSYGWLTPVRPVITPTATATTMMYLSAWSLLIVFPSTLGFVHACRCVREGFTIRAYRGPTILRPAGLVQHQRRETLCHPIRAPLYTVWARSKREAVVIAQAHATSPRRAVGNKKKVSYELHGQ